MAKNRNLLKKDLNMDELKKDWMPYTMLAIVGTISITVVVLINMQPSVCQPIDLTQALQGDCELNIDPWEYEKNNPPYNLFMGEDVEDSRLIP